MEELLSLHFVIILYTNMLITSENQGKLIFLKQLLLLCNNKMRMLIPYNWKKKYFSGIIQILCRRWNNPLHFVIILYNNMLITSENREKLIFLEQLLLLCNNKIGLKTPYNWEEVYFVVIIRILCRRWKKIFPRCNNTIMLTPENCEQLVLLEWSIFSA